MNSGTEKKNIPSTPTPPNMRHTEHHRIHRSGWLRAAVLGANDGIVSTASLIVGVAAAEANRSSILLAGVAGLVAGAMSMAAGEYVSVKSQEDTEAADLKMEALALESDHDGELSELAEIYRDRGLDQNLAEEVARQLMKHDALGAHARDEIGITKELSARPFDRDCDAWCTRRSCSQNRRSFAASRSHESLLLGISRNGAYCSGRKDFWCIRLGIDTQIFTAPTHLNHGWTQIYTDRFIVFFLSVYICVHPWFLFRTSFPRSAWSLSQ